MLRPDTGSRQSGATMAAGVSTKPRELRPGWGMESPGLLSAHMPPDHNRMSRSNTRARQLCPRRTRPKWLSISCRRTSSAGGSSSVDITAAALAKRRDDGPIGLDCMVAECANTSMSSISSAAIACGMIRFGVPMTGCGWFEPMPMR